MTPKNAKFEEATTLWVELRQSDIFFGVRPDPSFEVGYFKEH